MQGLICNLRRDLFLDDADSRPTLEGTEPERQDEPFLDTDGLEARRECDRVEHAVERWKLVGKRGNLAPTRSVEAGNLSDTRRILGSHRA